MKRIPLTIICLLTSIYFYLLHAQCPTAENVVCEMAAAQFDNVVIGEVSGDAAQSDGTNDAIVEIIGPPGTPIGCMVLTDTEWAVLIPPGTVIPADGVFAIGCVNGPGVGNDSGGVGLGGSTTTAPSSPNGLNAGGNGDWNAGVPIDMDICDPSNFTFFDPAASGFTLDNAGNQSANGDGEQVFLFLPDGTPHDGLIWDGGGTGNADHVSTSSGIPYTLGDNDGNGVVNDVIISVPGGRGDGGNSTAVPLLPTDDACPCNTTANPGTFTVPGYTAGDPTDLWIEWTTSDHVGCNSSFIRLTPMTTAGGFGGSPSHTDGEIEDATMDALGQNLDNGSGAGVMGDFGETTITSEGFDPNSFTPSSCDEVAAMAEWAYTDHPTPGEPNDDPTFIFYASETVSCDPIEVTITAEIYNWQHVEDAVNSTNQGANKFGSYIVDDTGTVVPWTIYNAPVGETTILEFTSGTLPPGVHTFEAVWDDWTDCCGSSSGSTSNECYESEIFTITILEPLVDATLDCTDGLVTININPATAAGITYELLDDAAYAATGGNVVASNTTGVFQVNAPATNTYFIRATQDGGCSTVQVMGTVCVFAPPCPEFTGFSACSSPAGDVCPGETIDIGVDGSDLPSGAVIEFVMLAAGDLDPYDNPATDVVASCVVPAPTIPIGGSNVYNGASGNFFSAQDMDGDGASATQMLTISGINIMGQTGLSFCIALAEEDGTGENWDAADEVLIDYSIDGGGSMDLLDVQSSGGTNTAPAIDTDFDGGGDGAVITSTFTNYTAPITGTGNMIDIVITFTLNDGGTDIAMDDIIVKSNQNPGGVYLLDFDANNSGFALSVPQFSDGTDDYFGVVGPDVELCKTITVSADLCGELNLAPRIMPDQTGCNMVTGGPSETPTLAPLTFNVDCPSAVIDATPIDICEADGTTATIPVTITGGTGPYTLEYSIDNGVTIMTLTAFNSGDVITINGPTAGEVKVILVSVTDENGAGCSGTVNDVEVCVNIRPTEELVLESSTDPLSCMPCDGTVTFSVTGTPTSNSFEIIYSIDGSQFQLAGVTMPFTLMDACPGVYDIVSVVDEFGCDMDIVSNPQTLMQPGGDPVTVSGGPGVLCDDGTESVDLTTAFVYNPPYDASTFEFFTIDPNTLPSTALPPNSNAAVSPSMLTSVTSNQTIWVQFTAANGCTSVAPLSIEVDPTVCFTCPTMGALAVSGDVCDDNDFTLTVDGLDDALMMQATGGGPYQIQFVYYTGAGSAPANPYTTPGTSLGTPVSSSGGVAVVTSTNAGLPAGDLAIVAILTPTPTDDTCIPFATVDVENLICEANAGGW